MATHSSDIYKEKGLERFMIVTKPDTRSLLNSVAKSHGIMQGEVIDVLLANANIAELVPKFKEVREAKLSERAATSKTDLKKQLAEATPEQIAEIQKILGKA